MSKNICRTCAKKLVCEKSENYHVKQEKTTDCPQWVAGDWGLDSLDLVDVYKYYKHYHILYELLKERTPEVSISHKCLPSFDNHVKFIDSKPYKHWFFITKPDVVGAIYLTPSNEIGVFVFKKYRRSGYATWAVNELIERSKQTKFLANINPENKISQKLFKKFGFKHIQNTYSKEIQRG
jgi:hypothetical protein